MTNGGGFEPGRFAHEVRQEIDKVVWPTRKETLTTTIAVVIFVALASVFLLLADQVIAYVIHDLLLDVQ